MVNWSTTRATCGVRRTDVGRATGGGAPQAAARAVAAKPSRRWGGCIARSLISAATLLTRYSRRLVNAYGLIVYEDLEITTLVRRPRHAPTNREVMTPTVPPPRQA